MVVCAHRSPAVRHALSPIACLASFRILPHARAWPAARRCYCSRATFHGQYWPAARSTKGSGFGFLISDGVQAGRHRLWASSARRMQVTAPSRCSPCSRPIRPRPRGLRHASRAPVPTIASVSPGPRCTAANFGVRGASPRRVRSNLAQHGFPDRLGSISEVSCRLDQ